MNTILSICLLVLTITCSVYCQQQRFIVASTDSTLQGAINNRTVTATIVDYMTSTCSRSKYIKPYFEQFSAQYKNFQFVEVFLDKYNPCFTCAPNLFENGAGISLPTLIVYKNGQKAERISPISSPQELESLITRNGGIKSY